LTMLGDPTAVLRPDLAFELFEHRARIRRII
jgi:hypothetical protein